ncbi:MAG: hypothetical protein VB143_02850 [Burkholderia sp.]
MRLAASGSRRPGRIWPSTFPRQHPTGRARINRYNLIRLNRLRFFWTRIWGKTCVWKRS